MKVQKRYLGLILVLILWTFPAMGQRQTFEFTYGEQTVTGSFEFAAKATEDLGTPIQKIDGVYMFDCSNIKINTQNQIFLVLKDFQYTGANNHIEASFNIEKWDEVSGGRQSVCLGSDATERLPFTPVKNGEGKVRIKYKLHLGSCSSKEILAEKEFTFSYNIFKFPTDDPKSDNTTVSPPTNTYTPPNNSTRPPQPPAAPTSKTPRLPESKTACAYREFIKNQPDTEIGRQADKILQEQILLNGIQYQKIQTTEPYRIEFQFSNVVQPRVDTIYGSAKKNLDTSKFACSGRLIIYDVTNPDSLYISISDKGKPKGKDSLVIILGNIFTVKTIRFDTDSIILLFSKGNPPYRITFYDAVGRPMMQPIGGITDTLWLFKVSQLTENKVYGTIHLEVNDSGNGLFISSDLNFAPPSQPWYWLLLLVLPVALYYLYMRRQRRIREKYWRMKEEKSAADLDLPTLKADTVPKNEPQAPAQPEASFIAGKSGGMTIKTRRASQGTEITILSDHADAPFQSNEQEYAGLRMIKHWEDSAVQAIYLNRSSVSDIDSFIRNHKNDPLDEQENSVPEIGGLLLGNVFQLPANGPYLIGIEKFVQIDPESHNNFQLEFSTHSLAHELGAVQDEFPNLTVVGWFHTHPGHGLFLSKPDLAIQDGFFGKQYQFAMEIDTLSEDLDTGFFTRRHSGQINNVALLRPGSRWFAWTEIEKITRKRS